MPSTNLVHVIDDDEAVRDSLKFLLRTAGMEVRTYESATAFLDALPGISAGCIITDVRMPDISGVDLLRRLKELKVGVPVIVITGHGDVQLAVEAMKIGAVDFIEKPFDQDALKALVERMLADARAQASETERRRLSEALMARLTAREQQVLERIVAGRLNKQIADDLGISIKTVEAHRANIMDKLNANTVADLMRTVLAGGGLRQ